LLLPALHAVTVDPIGMASRFVFGYHPRLQSLEGTGAYSLGVIEAA